MKLNITLNTGTYSVDTETPLDISIPLQFNAQHPIFWGAPQAIASTYTVGKLIGDTRRGGSSNVEEYHFIPHCHGTHTECIGHISYERISIHNVLKDGFIPSTLITVQPQPALAIVDQYLPSKDEEDWMISQQELIEKLKQANPDFLTGLIIRTLPNDDSKKSRNYHNKPPCFLSLEAIDYIVSLEVKHLLVDIPSIDRTYDQGYLSVHRKFWNIPLGEHHIELNESSLKTISEMIYVPNEIEDGCYLLNLQIPAFVADAAPCRPLLYSIKLLGH
ncbi:MAG TPA: cyclase family protein [Nostocaceae cyanobacterium]|nr:cyclase family protein [Nostocaceae cyanobacterium]